MPIIENASNPKGARIEVKAIDVGNLVINHPNPNIDLAMLPISGVLGNCRENNIQPNIKFISEEYIPDDNFLSSYTAYENVMMVGYPIGLWDNHNIKPIFRRGITATSPADNYQDRPEFLIDAACFPGSSGSPVYKFNRGLDIQAGPGIEATGFGPTLSLLGILYAGPQWTNEGEIEYIELPTKSIPLVKMQTPINLGIVLKSNLILDFKQKLPTEFHKMTCTP